MMTHPTSKQLKARARGILTGHYGLPVGAFLLTLLIVAALENLINMIVPYSISGIIISYLSLIIVSIFSSLLNTGYAHLMMNMARQKEYRLSDLFYVFKTMPDHVILLSIRIFLLSLASMVPMILGIVLVIIFPEMTALYLLRLLLLFVSLVLFIRVSIQYSQVFFIYLDNPYLSSKEVMAESKRLMQGNGKRYLYLSVSFLGMLLLGLLSLYVGYLWITPYMTMTRIEFYRDLIGETSDIEN